MAVEPSLGSEQRLRLPQVSLCAVTSINLKATIRALEACLEQISFASCKLFTDASVRPADPAIQVVPISPLRSAADYSRFMLSELVDHVDTTHCLVVQWDGHVLDSRQWRPEFLDYDYIGAPWPQFRDGHDVGNGGFSLRSRRLLEACRDPRFIGEHPEDVAICRTNREFLECVHELRFADREAAERFAYERTTPNGTTFGYHGIFHMIPILGPDRFWQIYLELDDRSTAFTDCHTLIRQLGAGRHTTTRRIRLMIDLLSGLRLPWVRLADCLRSYRKLLTSF